MRGGNAKGVARFKRKYGFVLGSVILINPANVLPWPGQIVPRVDFRKPAAKPERQHLVEVTAAADRPEAEREVGPEPSQEFQAFVRPFSSMTVTVIESP